MAKVLIIEDEKAMSDLIAIKFKVEGFEVEQASNFAEAKQKLTSGGPFDAMLTDYLLPDGDLVDFLTTIRGDANFQALPTIVMTNYIEDLNIEKLKTQGVSEAIVKYQVVPAQMVEKIKALIGSAPVSDQPVVVPPVSPLGVSTPVPVPVSDQPVATVSPAPVASESVVSPQASDAQIISPTQDEAETQPAEDNV